MKRNPDAVRETLAAGSPKICPSLLNCDFGKLAEEIRFSQSCGACSVHWDVMDGDFVPNFTYGPPIIRSLRPQSDLIFDAHLMMSRPENYLDEFLVAGCDIITFHWEAVSEPAPLIDAVHAGGALAGMAINPSTSVEEMKPWLETVDLVLVMSVQPGFGGQKFDATALDKLRWVRENAPSSTLIQVDGGVNRETIKDAVNSGAQLLVVGSAFFHAEDRKLQYDLLSRMAAE